jgi:hypothetical protein
MGDYLVLRWGLEIISPDHLAAGMEILKILQIY